jgi:hypothetical protein
MDRLRKTIRIRAWLQTCHRIRNECRFSGCDADGQSKRLKPLGILHTFAASLKRSPDTNRLLIYAITELCVAGAMSRELWNNARGIMSGKEPV